MILTEREKATLLFALEDWRKNGDVYRFYRGDGKHFHHGSDRKLAYLSSVELDQLWEKVIAYEPEAE